MNLRQQRMEQSKDRFKDEIEAYKKTLQMENSENSKALVSINDEKAALMRKKHE